MFTAILCFPLILAILPSGQWLEVLCNLQTRYLRWLGHDTKHFNVGKYRRLVHGANQSADFFRADNQEAVNARHQVAALAMEDMLTWMEGGGQVRFRTVAFLHCLSAPEARRGKSFSESIDC